MKGILITPYLSLLIPAYAAILTLNVLLIAVNDLNDWVGCLGGKPDTKTPNIDRLARRGMVFANAQCAAPSCVRSRSALILGIWPAESGLYDNSIEVRGFRNYADIKNRVTLIQYAAQQVWG